jgi:hypothetical protein
MGASAEVRDNAATGAADEARRSLLPRRRMG